MPNCITDYRQGKHFIALNAIAQLLRQFRDNRAITYWAIDGYVWIEDDSISNPYAPYSLRKTGITSVDFVRCNN
jgi:hypothetical protein